ncbi:MAG: hypothetical protein ACOCX2_12870 [Armatimonadota bacterium]
MKMRATTFVLLALLGAAFAVGIVGCAEEPDVTTETVDEIPEAAEEVYTDEPEDPGQEETSGVDAEEMTTDTPPPVRDDEGEETGDEAETDENAVETAPAPDDEM